MTTAPNPKDDKELLELAAHAAGLQVQRSRLDDPLARDFLIKGEGPRNEGQAAYPWNPLTDDGDALRLAVKLRLDIQINCDEAAVISADVDGWVSEPVIDEDIGAATRRAIVRAAAAIARQESSHDS